MLRNHSKIIFKNYAGRISDELKLTIRQSFRFIHNHKKRRDNYALLDRYSITTKSGVSSGIYRQQTMTSGNSSICTNFTIYQKIPENLTFFYFMYIKKEKRGVVMTSTLHRMWF